MGPTFVLNDDTGRQAVKARIRPKHNGEVECLLANLILAPGTGHNNHWADTA